MSISRDLEIRHLPLPKMLKLCEILDKNKAWAKLMEQIPKDMNVIYQQAVSLHGIKRKYSTENIHLIKKESETLRSSPTRILFDEWGTSGRKRPTVGDLLRLLIEIELFRAADYVAVEILDELPPNRPLTGPAARVDISLPPDLLTHVEAESILNALTYPKSSNLGITFEEDVVNNNKDYPINIDDDRVKIDNFKQSTKTMRSNETSNLILFSKETQNLETNNDTSNLILFSKETQHSEINNMSNILHTRDESSELLNTSATLSSETESEQDIRNQHIPETDYMSDSVGQPFNSNLSNANMPNISAALRATNSNLSHTMSQSLLPDISKLHINSSSSSSEHNNSSQLSNIPQITMLQDL